MAVNVVLECGSHGWLRLRRWVATAVGGLLMFIGSLALLVAFPSVFGAVPVIWSYFSEESVADIPLPPGSIVLVAASSTALATVALKLALRMLRANRKLVLFLRRFGYDEATGVVTFAAIKTIGHSWRLVTLDDGEVAPLGVPTGWSRLLRATEALQKFPGLAVDVFVKYFFPISILLGFGIVVLESLEIQALRPAGTHDAYVEIVERLLDGHVPFDAVGPSLPGAFAALCILTFFVSVTVLGGHLLDLVLAPVLS